MTDAVVVFVTTNSSESAKTLAKGIVESKLAACVNILPHVTSVYVWEEALHEDGEVLLMIKTEGRMISPLTLWIKENHPYDVPEVIALPVVGGSLDYLSWITTCINGRS